MQEERSGGARGKGEGRYSLSEILAVIGTIGAIVSIYLGILQLKINQMLSTSLNLAGLSIVPMQEN